LSDKIPSEYTSLLIEIKERIRSAQLRALRQVNSELVALYEDIGQSIVARQEGETWGKSVVSSLARDLAAEFPATQGFSAANLWRMKLFYETYGSDEKLAPLVREIAWSHNVVILEKCKKPEEREFYIRMTRRFGWTRNVLVHQIENRTYEKTLFNQTNFDQTLPEEIRKQAQLAVKDEYTFGFLELAEEHSERELEDALTERVEDFLREMGGMFTFVGSQYRLSVSDRDYFIDLLLYHRRLRALVAIDLKIGEFLPEYVGKMQFYLAALDEKIRLPGENPSIGIILCKSKDRTIVEYALRQAAGPIGVAKYEITATLPAEFTGELPAPDQIAKLLSDIST
jgi:predicted nuclease of restriction endonuclease-like (RecB) superfamily